MPFERNNTDVQTREDRGSKSEGKRRRSALESMSWAPSQLSTEATEEERRSTVTVSPMTCLHIAVFSALHLFFLIYVIFLLFTNKCIHIYTYIFFSILFLYLNTGGIFVYFGSGNSFALHLAAALFPQLEMAVGIEREMGSQSSWENSIDVRAREVSENVDATGGS